MMKVRTSFVFVCLFDFVAGYVQVFPMNKTESLRSAGILEANRWLDRYTRAVFSEFAIYNANVNLFCVVTLLFEQLPTGSLTPYPSILALRLYRYTGGEMFFVLACEITYLLFSAFFVVREIRLFIKKGKEHLKDPWGVLEIFVTLLSLSAVGLYFARMKFRDDALDTMRATRSGFVSFHYTAFLDEWLKCITGIIVFLSFIKMFRLLRFNRRMSMLQQVLKRCIGELVSFMFMLALAFLAFALLASLVFGQSTEGFGTFYKSCASLMDTLLGKFTLKEMLHANRIIGPIFFCSYTVFMVFILINMFVSIINDAFTEVRSDVEKQSNEYEIVDFMIHRLKENIGKSMGHAIHPIYKEPKSELELKFDTIVGDADNAIHFMRNIAFEDMRKTRWFQTENCSEKKKNLIRLLMEVDWDFYESELCDSIPVFERFLSQRTEEELEEILQCYRQKRMVEDLVFDVVKTKSDSDSDSEEDNDTDDKKSSHDERGSEDEPVSADDTKMLTPAFDITKRHGSAVSVRDTPFLVIDTEEAKTEEQNNAENPSQNDGTSPRGSIVEEAASEAELLKILDEVRQQQESSRATDAELDSILYGDTPVHDNKSRMYNSDMEIDDRKKNERKNKKKKAKEDDRTALQEQMPRQTWIEMKNEKDTRNPTEGLGGTKTPREEALDRNDSQEGEDKDTAKGVKTKKKEKRKAVSRNEDEALNEENNIDNASEINAEGETDNGDAKAKKRKKQKKPKEPTIKENDQHETTVSDVKKKKKKAKEHKVEKAPAQTDDEKAEVYDEKRNKKKKGEITETVEVAAVVENYDGAAADINTEKPKRKKKKKKRVAGEENTAFEKEANEDENTLEKEGKGLDEKLEKLLFEETLQLEDVDDQAETKRKKKRKAKKKLNQQNEDGQNLVPLDDTEEGKEKETSTTPLAREESEC